MLYLKNHIEKVIIAILVTILFISFYENKKKANKIEDFEELVKYKDSRMDSLQNKLGQTVYDAEVAKQNNEKFIAELSKEVFNLQGKYEKQVKEYHALLRVKQKVQIDTLEIPFIITDSFPVQVIDGMVKADSVVIPPKDFKASNDYYSVSGTVQLKSVKINQITLYDTSSFRIVDIKKGLFSKRETHIQAIHSNHYFKNENMQMIMKRGDKPTRWQVWIKPLITGIAASFLTYKVLRL